MRGDATEMTGVLSWKNRIFCFCCKLISDVNVALSTQWCRSWGWRRTPKSFDLSLMRAKSLKFGHKSFRQFCSRWMINDS